MPKRKAAGRAKKSGAGQAKKPRHSDPAAAAHEGHRDAALARARLAPLVVTQTLRLIDAIQATDGSCAQRVQSVVKLVKEDAHRPESLIDLSLPLEGDMVSPFYPNTASPAARTFESDS